MTAGEKINEIAIIILAAGSSSRLGKPKQLLNYQGQNLLNHAIETATVSNAGSVIVVLGSNATEIEKQIHTDNVYIVFNENYEEGMASSIRCGLEASQKLPTPVNAIILMLCDQPFVNTSLLNDIIKTHKDTDKAIVSCSYVNTFGPPTLFHKSIFNELLELKGDIGARKIIHDHINDTATIPFEVGEVDIDTEADFQKLINKPAQ